MPLTPFHLFPAGTVYFLFYRRLHGLAFFMATVLIDVEPMLYLVFGLPSSSFSLLFGGSLSLSYHSVTHNPFGIFFVVAPLVAILARFLEFGKPLWLQILPGAEWVNYSWKLTYLSAVFGCFLHLAWDATMHGDINFGFPFMQIANPFMNGGAASWIGIFSLVFILPAYLVGTLVNEGNPFRKLP